MNGPDRNSRNDPPFTGKAPTLSGYLDYAAARDGNDLARKAALEAQEHQQSRVRAFRPKPAIAHYAALYRDKRRLSAHGRGENQFSGRDAKAFAAYARDRHVARLNDPGDRRAAADYIMARHEQWRHDHRILDTEQRASLADDVRYAVRARRNRPGNSQDRDTAEFFATAQVVATYCIEHENLNAAFEKDVSAFVDAAVARRAERIGQSMTDVGAFDIVRSRRKERERDQKRER